MKKEQDIRDGFLIAASLISLFLHFYPESYETLFSAKKAFLTSVDRYFIARTLDLPANSTKVLFIGNSLTSANNLPDIVQKIAASKYISMSYATQLVGGARFSDHLMQQKLDGLLSAASWDAAVLQEQSQVPSFHPSQAANEMYPYAAELTHRIRNAHSQTKIIFYEGMAHKEGDALNKKYDPEVATYNGMQQRIHDAYNAVVTQNNASLAPVGVVWSGMLQKHPEISLYADHRHPNLAGTYLASCVIFSTIFQQPCANSFIPEALDKNTAHTIQLFSDRALEKKHE